MSGENLKEVGKKKYAPVLELVYRKRSNRFAARCECSNHFRGTAAPMRALMMRIERRTGGRGNSRHRLFRIPKEVPIG